MTPLLQHLWGCGLAFLGGAFGTLWGRPCQRPNASEPCGQQRLLIRIRSRVATPSSGLSANIAGVCDCDYLGTVDWCVQNQPLQLPPPPHLDCAPTDFPRTGRPSPGAAQSRRALSRQAQPAWPSVSVHVCLFFLPFLAATEYLCVQPGTVHTLLTCGRDLASVQTRLVFQARFTGTRQKPRVSGSSPLSVLTAELIWRPTASDDD